MDEEILKQIFDELFSALEPLETQTVALLRFLKSKGIATDQEFAAYLEEAGNASNVRWRAARVRTAALIASALRPPEKSVEPIPSKKEETSSNPSAEGTDKVEQKSAQEKKAEPPEKEPTNKESKKTEEKSEETTKTNPKKAAA